MGPPEDHLNDDRVAAISTSATRARSRNSSRYRSRAASRERRWRPPRSSSWTASERASESSRTPRSARRTPTSRSTNARRCRRSAGTTSGRFLSSCRLCATTKRRSTWACWSGDCGRRWRSIRCSRGGLTCACRGGRTKGSSSRTTGCRCGSSRMTI